MNKLSNKLNSIVNKPNGLLIACAFVASAGSLDALTYDWNVAGPSTFNDANNWTVVGLPGSSDVAHVDNGGTLTISDTDPDWALIRLHVGDATGDVGFVHMTGGTLSNSSELRIGYGGTGTFTLDGGTVNANSNFYLALLTGSEGNLNQSGGTINVDGFARIGHRGSAVMNMTAGIFDVSSGDNSNFVLGNRSSGVTAAHGTLNQSGGQIDAGVFTVGDGYVSSDRSESGVYNLSSSGVLNTGDFLVGRLGGHGRVEMTDGEINVSNFLAVGHNDGSNGIFNQSGGTVNMTSGTTYIARQASGDSATGVWTLSDAGVANLDDLLIGQATGSGTLTLNGGTLSASQIRTEVSGSGMSILNLNGGEIVARSSNATFLEGLTEANVQAGGVTFDTDGNDITIGQDLLDDDAGDVIKAGVGVMTFSGGNTYLGDTVVQAGTLILADGGSMTFAIGEDGSSNMITGTGTVDLSGLLVFDFENLSSSTANAWTIVDSSLTASYGETFSILNFTESGAGIWTLEADNLTYTFSESTGILSAVPEPAQFALLMGLLVVGASVVRRKPRVVA